MMMSIRMNRLIALLQIKRGGRLDEARAEILSALADCLERETAAEKVKILWE